MPDAPSRLPPRERPTAPNSAANLSGVENDAWRVCITCPPGENEWPATEFYGPDWPRCKACYADQKALNKKLKVLADTPEERLRLRKRMGICQECPNPVEGAVGRAHFCPACNRRRRKKREQRRRRHPEVLNRRATLARERHAERMANDPEYVAAYRKRRQRETLASSPSYPKRIEYFRNSNADPARAQAKRDWATRKYYELHPERPRPICATCNEPIPYNGKGKPPKYHQTDCIPYPRGRRRAAA